MTPFVPYHIQHIKLNALESIPAFETGRYGAYCVIWWHEIPLGHIYLQPDESLKSESFFCKIKDATLTTIQFYLRKGNIYSEDSFQALTKENFNFWRRYIDTHLVELWKQPIPSKVPVTVIVCTRNRPQLLQKCLQQLNHLHCIPEEIVVVDNASDTDETQLVVAQFKEIKYIKEPRLGLDFARNTGIKKASNAILAYVDDDVIVHPDWLYWVWDSFQDKTVMAMTGLVVAQKLETEAQQIFEKYWSFNRGYVDKVYDTTFFKNTLHKGPPVWEIGAGANMAFRKSIFDEVGLFDELLDVGAAGCNGDSEMWFRILAKAHTIVYNPRAVVFHEHRSDLAGLRKQIYYYMRGYTAAALSQQRQLKASGYYRQLFKRLPIHYLKSIKKGYPNYSSQYETIWVEMKGVLSGLFFYLKNRNQFIHTNRKTRNVVE